MEKKLYLRIQAFILALLIMLTACVLVPQQIQADETVIAIEESAPVMNEAETEVLAAGDAEVHNDAETVAPGETEAEVPTEGEVGVQDETEQTPDEPMPADTTPEQTSDPAPEDMNPTKTDDQTAEVAAENLAEVDAAGDARSGGDFEFDVATGTITAYLGTNTVVDIPASIDGVDVTAMRSRRLIPNISRASRFRTVSHTLGISRFISTT